jgi:precorrin-2 dehydrogenase/sirohydrochlorin ferrochelatase
MAYFPMFYNLEDKKILVIGGGNIATQKLEKLVIFTKDITIITKELSLECHNLIKENCLTLYQRAYKKGDIDSFDIVIVATNNIKMHQEIFNESRAKNILVNSVDNTKYCDFIFPSFIKKGDLTVAISTSGASPAFAKHFKAKIESTIPDDIEDFLQKLKELRESMPKGKERMDYFEKLVIEYLK